MFLTNIPSYSNSNITSAVGNGKPWLIGIGFGTNIGRVIGFILPYTFLIAGIILFIYLIIGGFKLLTAGANPKEVAAGQKILTNALIGFLIVISSYWIYQIIRFIFALPTPGA